MGFRYYEQIKPIEWEVGVSTERLLGFVDEIRWMNFLQKSSSLSGVYFRTRPPEGRLSVLLPFPLHPEECLKRRVFQWLSPESAELIEERTMQVPAK